MTGSIDPQRAVTHRLRIAGLKIGAQNLNPASPNAVLTGLLFLSEKASKDVLLLLLLFAWF